eukprot:1194483-Prorocentrum_minimum.AAC.3
MEGRGRGLTHRLSSKIVYCVPQMFRKTWAKSTSTQEYDWEKALREGVQRGFGDAAASAYRGLVEKPAVLPRHSLQKA